jgi:hypothetical protein
MSVRSGYGGAGDEHQERGPATRPWPSIVNVIAENSATAPRDGDPSR